MTTGPTSIKRDLRQEITDQIIEALKKGTAPWQKPWSSGAFELPFNPTSGKTYRGGNAIHLMAMGSRHGYEDSRWLTYRQAQENGWQVRRGEKGTQVEFWQFPGSGNLSGAREDRDPSEPTGRDRFIYRVYTVFNGSQIDGLPPHSPRVRQEWEAVQSAESILRNSGARISHDQADQAFYHRHTDSIHLPPRAAFQSNGAYYGTALHELSHWTGHPSRLNRDTLHESYRFGDANYAKEELRAELASVFLMAERGIPHDPERHASYLSSWLDVLRKDKHEIFRAARDAHRAVDFLMALEMERSLDRALAQVGKAREESEPIMQSKTAASGSVQPVLGSKSRPVEMEL